MNISEACDYLLFFINKYQGKWYDPTECCKILDRGQMAYYADMKSKYATSTQIKEILSPFKLIYDFTPSNSISGYVVVPSNVGYLDFLDMQIEVDISSRIVYTPVEIVSEDTRAERLSSQIDPVTEANPIAEIINPRYFKMYPTAGYRGRITYLKRPATPVFGYVLVSGRRIVYDPDTSVQLEWRDSELDFIIMKSLQTMGINLSDQEIAQYSQAKQQENYNNINRS